MSTRNLLIAGAVLAALWWWTRRRSGQQGVIGAGAGQLRPPDRYAGRPDAQVDGASLAAVGDAAPVAPPPATRPAMQYATLDASMLTLSSAQQPVGGGGIIGPTQPTGGGGASCTNCGGGGRVVTAAQTSRYQTVRL